MLIKVLKSGRQIFFIVGCEGADYRFDDLFKNILGSSLGRNCPEKTKILQWTKLDYEGQKTILPKQFGTLFIFSID